jgi:isocitrate lyase
MGYRFQFVTLAGFHSLNLTMFNLARDYRERGMAAYCELQQAEFAAEAAGYTATRHQREVGVGYFDAVASVVSGGHSSTTALAGSTEAAQFCETEPRALTHHGHDDGLVHNHDWAVHDWAAYDLAASRT